MTAATEAGSRASVATAGGNAAQQSSVKSGTPAAAAAAAAAASESKDAMEVDEGDDGPALTVIVVHAPELNLWGKSSDTERDSRALTVNNPLGAYSRIRAKLPTKSCLKGFDLGKTARLASDAERKRTVASGSSSGGSGGSSGGDGGGSGGSKGSSSDGGDCDGEGGEQKQAKTKSREELHDTRVVYKELSIDEGKQLVYKARGGARGSGPSGRSHNGGLKRKREEDQKRISEKENQRHQLARRALLKRRQEKRWRQQQRWWPAHAQGVGNASDVGGVGVGGDGGFTGKHEYRHTFMSGRKPRPLLVELELEEKEEEEEGKEEGEKDGDGVDKESKGEDKAKVATPATVVFPFFAT